LRVIAAPLRGLIERADVGAVEVVARISPAEVVNEASSGSLDADRARLDGGHAIEIDIADDAL
jgi:hypothetical protein